MKQSVRIAIAIAAAVVTMIATGARAQHDPRSIRHKIADAYGVHSFDTVEKLSFTFNVKAGEREVKRSWSWWPKEDRVRFDGGDWNDGEPYQYLRADIASDSATTMVEADQRFINDTYWLMFPFHVEWDDRATVTEEGMAPLPIGEGEARKVVVDYTGAGGYTPGDVYDLYLGPDYRIVQWVYHSGGQAEGSAITWTDNESFGNLTFCTNHVSPGGARLFMTDISVETTKE